MNPELLSKLLGKDDLCAEKLPLEYEDAFLGWSMYQPHHHLPSPVYSIERIQEINPALTLGQVYDSFVRGNKKTFAPIFVSTKKVTKTTLGL